MNIIYYCCLALVFLGQSYLSYEDIRKREIKYLYVCMLLYIPALVGSYIRLGLGTDLFIGFAYFSVSLYLMQILNYFLTKSNEGIIGGADILMAPIYTTWFGFSGGIIFIFCFVFILLIAKIKPIFEKLGGKNSPILFLFQIAFVISYLISLQIG